MEEVDKRFELYRIGSLIRIINTIIRLNTNRIRIVVLNFEALSLSFVIVNVNIIIPDNVINLFVSVLNTCAHKIIKLTKN